MSSRPAQGGGRRRGTPPSNRRRPPRPETARIRALPPAELPGTKLVRSWQGNALLALPAIVIVLGGVVLGLGVLAVGVVLIVLGLGLWLSSMALAAPSRLVALLGGRDASELHDARLINVVDGLCVANGIVMPRLIVLDDPAPNAIAIGSSPDAAALICTTGLLAMLDRLELEGIVAHELAHVKRGDTRAAARAGMTIGLLAVVARHGGRLLDRAGDVAREARADALASAMTRYPPGLRQALEKLEAAEETRPAIPERVARLTAAFWCVPLDASPKSPPRREVLDLELRVAALAEL